MSDAMRIAVTGIMAAVCAIVVRKQMPELAMLLALSAGILILIYCSGMLESILSFVGELTETGEIAPVAVVPVIKVTGIGIVTKLAADVCRDANEGALAAVVETAGGIVALTALLPLMSAMIELLKEML